MNKAICMKAKTMIEAWDLDKSEDHNQPKNSIEVIELAQERSKLILTR